MPKSVKILLIYFAFIIFFSLFISCEKSLEPLDKNIQYSVNIMFVKDDNMPSFEAIDFINIFNKRLPFLTYQILGYKIKYNLSSGNSVQNFYRLNRKTANNNSKLFKNNYDKDIIYSSSYWKIIGKEIKDYNIIIVNIPINSDGAFIDRLVLENKKINPAKSLAIISAYPLLLYEKYLDKETLLNIFEYYVLQTMAMMFPKYDIHELEKHSIMSKVNNFDYYNWRSNIINFPLREPYKSLKKFD